MATASSPDTVLTFDAPASGILLNSPTAPLDVVGPLGQAAGLVLNSALHASLPPDIDGRSATLTMAIQDHSSGPSEDGALGATEGKDMKEDRKPAWSELKTKAGKERKRLPLACIACRRKKIRCSGEKPCCKHCQRSRTPCVYKVTTRKAAPRTDYMSMLDKRLKRMEERVIRIIPDPDTSKMASIGRANVKPPAVPAPRSIGKKRAAEEAFGTELEQWAHGDAKGDAARQAVGTEHGDNRLLTDGVEHLPPEAIQVHLAETFFENCYGQAYYLLHKPSFMRRLTAGTIPPVLTLAVCSVAARFSTHPDVGTDPPFLRGEQWAKPAREIAIKRYDEPNITILIVLVILSLHEFGTCQGGRSWMLGGMAIRMAASLQLHRELDHDPLVRKRDKSTELNITDREIRRRAMWACFMMDRFISSGTERPMVLDEETIEVQLPLDEQHFQMELPGVTERLDGTVVRSNPDEDSRDVSENMGVAAYLTRTIALWGRVVRYLNLGGRKRDPHPMWDPESTFMQLKKQADELQKSFPARLQYTPENLRTHAGMKLGHQFLFLHVSVQQIILFLHKFAIPTRPNTSPAKDMPKEFVQASFRPALDAAGRISELLSEAPSHPLMAPFAGYCAFLSSTVHIWGIFSKNAQLKAQSERYLAINVKYLSHMKRIWGVLHHMFDNLRTIYRQFADAPSTNAKTSAVTSGRASPDHQVLHYGGWFNEFPRGVSQSDYQEPAASDARDGGNDAALSQKSDLQTVEEFFDTPTPPPVLPQRKGRKQATAKATAAASQRHPQRPHVQRPPSQASPTAPSQASPTAPAYASLKPDASWSTVPISVPQGAYSNMPHSAFAIPGHPSQQQQFRRPSHGQPRTSQQMPPQPARQRSSFDSANLAQHPHLNRANLDGFGGVPGANLPMYSPPAFPSPHSATVTTFPNTPFFGVSNGGSDPAQLPISIHDLDQQMVYETYATDPGVQTGLWDAGVNLQMDLPGGDPSGGGGDVGSGDGHSAPPEVSQGEEFMGVPGDSSAWFMPFNMDVGGDEFSGGMGLEDGLGDGEESKGEGM